VLHFSVERGIDVSPDIVKNASKIMAKNIKAKDSLHIACALEAKCKYFITTDRKVLNKSIDDIIIINPVDFEGMAGDEE
jgi:predicted nucleic acid-binding protein